MIHPTYRRIAAIFGMAALLMSIGAASASADSSAIYSGCKTGSSLAGYSKSDLQNALSGVPADLDEYFGCSGQINKALADKALKGVPGGSSKGVKGTKAMLKAASANDLTTAAERKKLSAQVSSVTQVGKNTKPLSSNSDPAISTSAGYTLASSSAPGTPTALIIGVLGLLILLGADLAGRLGTVPRVKKYLPRSGPRDDG